MESNDTTNLDSRITYLRLPWLLLLLLLPPLLLLLLLLLVGRVVV